MKILHYKPLTPQPLHRRPLKLPRGDVLIFAGDAGLSNLNEIQQFEMWLEAQPFKHKVVIFGNMDTATRRY